MKTRLLLLLTAFFTVGLFAQQHGKYFFVKSGHIEYALGGNTTGTKSVWFDNYGMLISDVSTLGVSYTETATSFDTNIAVLATKFEIPTNVKFEDMGEMLNMPTTETN